ncbi:hypothetical protein F1559_000035 [Cyanidiococcus yangmingshanensis]|uniref:Secreted protein n=1 Tax=Cyanidiococcus yangmingshanensis TaxID=2690220 RepID=A0A7J7IER4_9RHOD|nr:hypothetical protein F1559_000035 [Cyanidiococcus yangmingshanensis]
MGFRPRHVHVFLLGLARFWSSLDLEMHVFLVCAINTSPCRRSRRYVGCGIRSLALFVGRRYLAYRRSRALFPDRVQLLALTSRDAPVRWAAQRARPPDDALRSTECR